MTLHEVSFRYGSAPLIEDLSLSIHPGEILGVIGPNGGGKTTLLRVGMVFQHPHQQIFERSVRRELEIEGALDADRRTALLAQARLAGLEEAAPLSLSLGEQRRLTVVTALRTRPG